MRVPQIMDRSRFLLVLGLALPCAAAPSVGVQAMPTTQVSATATQAQPAAGLAPQQATTNGDRAALDAGGKPDASWTKRMVRPCVRSGSRMVC